MDYEHNILWYIELKVWWRWIGNDLYVWSGGYTRTKITQYKIYDEQIQLIILR